jgi:O-methyltransferase
MVLDGLLKSALVLPGELAECGVYKGGTARLIAGTRTASGARKRLFLLDTFKGMPEPTPGLDSTWRAGDLGDVNIEEVKQFLADLPDIVILPGLFSTTLPQLSDSRFCFVHVDADLYTSVRECCEFFWPRMVNGGVVVFDDYGFSNCPGAKKAIDEYFAKTTDKVVPLPTAQAFVVKHSTDG